MHPRLAVVLSLLALVLSGAALALGLRPAEAGAAEVSGAPGEPAGELAHHMAYAQRFAEKLYFAGMADHAALASFYVHELEETFEAVAAGGYVEDGRDVGEATRALFLPHLAGVEAALEAGAPNDDAEEARGLFEARYRALVLGCNACHEATGHGFVRITVPEASSFPNQTFARPGTE